MNKLLSVISCCFVFLFTACTNDFSPPQNASAITLIPDLGDFRLKVMTQMPDGNILLAGPVKRYDSDLRLMGTDTSVFYIINPDTREVKKIDALKNRFGFLYGAIGTSDGGMLIHYESFDKNASHIVSLDRNFKTIDSINTKEHLSPDLNYENSVDGIIRLKDGNFLIPLPHERRITKINSKLQTIWSRYNGVFVAFYDYESNDGSIWSAGGVIRNQSLFLALLKTQNDGKQIFLTKGLGVPDAGFWDVVESNGKFLASGYTNTSSSYLGTSDGIIVTYNANGDSLGHKIFSTPEDDFGRKLIPTDDGGYIFLMTKIIDGSTRSIRILKLNSELNTQWEKEILKLGKSNTAPTGIKLMDGRIVIGCFGEAATNTLNGMDASLIFLDKNGNF